EAMERAVLVAELELEVAGQLREDSAAQERVTAICPLAGPGRREDRGALIREDQRHAAPPRREHGVVVLEGPADAKQSRLRVLGPVVALDSDRQAPRQDQVGLLRGEATGREIDGLAAGGTAGLAASDLVGD